MNVVAMWTYLTEPDVRHWLVAERVLAFRLHARPGHRMDVDLSRGTE